jgi:nucleoid-associated protein YgaU
MKKVGAFIVFGVIFLMGCVAVRTYTVEKPRVDRDIQGNQGYLFGSPADQKGGESRLGDTRKTTVFEIDLGPSGEDSDGDYEGGTVETSSEESASEYEMDLYDVEDEDFYVEEIIIDEPEESFEYYVVQKNDTLQKISMKFYGTTAKWKTIYDFNKREIKNPDKVYPGMKIKVPSL